jgi:DNA-binding response OmpR family regulator
MARTILIVEDDEATRVGLLVLLAEAGYRTVGAGTLKQATELLAQQNPDLMIVDVRLGGDNGLQLVAMAIHPIPPSSPPRLPTPYWRRKRASSAPTSW